MKRLIILFVLFAFILVGCGRDLSTPSSRLVGHWRAKTGIKTEYYINKIDPKTKEGTITEYDPGAGTVFIGKYTIFSEAPDKEEVTLDVDWPGDFDFGNTEFWVQKDGMSATMHMFWIEYVDGKTEP